MAVAGVVRGGSSAQLAAAIHTIIEGKQIHRAARPSTKIPRNVCAKALCRHTS